MEESFTSPGLKGHLVAFCRVVQSSTGQEGGGCLAAGQGLSFLPSPNDGQCESCVLFVVFTPLKLTHRSPR